MSLLVPKATCEGRIDSVQWASQTLIWAERQRGRGLIWPAGESWFTNDPLGHMPHTHPDASEVYFVASGTMAVTVGRTEATLRGGDYCLIPPDTYHDPLNVGGDDLCLFVIVAPNWRDRRWKASDFVESDYLGKPALAPTAVAGPLPSDTLIEASVVVLDPGERGELEARARADRAIYVLEGKAEIAIDHLGGELAAHEYLHVMNGARHRVANAGETPLRYLSIWTPDASL